MVCWRTYGTFALQNLQTRITLQELCANVLNTNDVPQLGHTTTSRTTLEQGSSPYAYLYFVRVASSSTQWRGASTRRHEGERASQQRAVSGAAPRGRGNRWMICSSTDMHCKSGT